MLSQEDWTWHEALWGKILWVDLSKKQIKEEALDEKMGRDFLGGYGLGARILFSRQKAGVDPLGPDAILGLVTGVLTGTDAMGGSRYVMVGKSPLTGGWGDANSGGNVGPYLKFAGYDAVFFTGISSKPVYLLIDNGKAELKDAGKLWGKDYLRDTGYIKGRARQRAGGGLHRAVRREVMPYRRGDEQQRQGGRALRTRGGDGLEEAQGDRGERQHENTGS